MKKLLPVIFFFTLAVSFEAEAQCAMCRRIAQTNYEQQDLIAKQKEMKRGRSLNNGILYLLSIPYLIGGVGAFFWWKNRKRY
jgi:hypothetical protein